MAGIIKADTIYGESSLRLNVGEVTLINVNATAFNVAQPLNVQTNATVTGNLIVLGNMTVDGTQFVTNTEILVVEDKNIEIANVANPTTTTANGAGITVRTGSTAAGSRDPSIQWELPNQAFLINQGIDIQQVTERANVSANTLNGVSNFDVLEGAVKFYTNNPTGNWTINVRGSSSNSFDSMTATGDSVPWHIWPITVVLHTIKQPCRLMVLVAQLNIKAVLHHLQVMPIVLISTPSHW